MAVQGLLARALTFHAVKLTWKPETYALGYIIFRGTSVGFPSATQLANVAPDAGTYTDYTGAPGIKYYYWVMTAPAHDKTGPVDATTYPIPNDSPAYGSILGPLAEWASTASGGVPAIWANQPGVEPVKPFIRLSLTGPLKVPATDYYDPALSSVSGMRRWIVSVNIFTGPVGRDDDGDVTGLDAMDLANRLVGSFEDPATEDAFSAAGIADAGIESSVNDISTLLGTKWERQAHFDFSLNAAFNLTVSDPGTIDTVDVTAVKAAFDQS